MSRGSYESYVAMFGTIISGNVSVILNPDMPLEMSRSQMEIADIEELYFDYGVQVKGEWKIRAFYSLEEIINEINSKSYGENVKNYGTDPDEIAMILFSSGTSGTSKGVMLSQKNMMTRDWDLTKQFNTGRVMLCMPFYHVGGVHFLIEFMRYPLTFCISKSPKYFAKDLKRFAPTILAMVPAQLEFIVKKGESDEELCNIIKNNLDFVICVGASLDNKFREVSQKWKFQFLTAYGLTETWGTLTELFPYKEGSVGKLTSVNQYKIQDGELLVKGNSVMLGYYNNVNATKEAIKDGWFYTGDLIKIDDEGFVYLIGRKKNIIILSNGKNVSPEELERKIQSLPYVKEVIVTGRDMVIEAMLFLGENDNKEHRSTVEKNIKSLNRELPLYQQIRKLTFFDQPFERTSSGKIKR